MTIKVNIDLERAFTVDADIDTVFLLLSDVPASAAYFPNVHKLTPLTENAYRWDIEKVAVGLHSIQTSYACEYHSDLATKTIVWEPIKDEGNALVAGKWELTELDKGTSIVFSTSAVLRLAMPGFLSMGIAPLVKFEFTGMVDTYLQNLKDAWEQ
ncbi:SRPBCC family protein [Glaciecola sp. XM2]|jgi:carbon monoxide dehydrogenase subunit G|uniref:SRPBCC family protein n=1 Tax=Glaciecola sp. XM2 TaxID=1914931 RepID=UPI001BDED3B6|nr:SRPBCC family protein [Glaciecola sp. XM2]MBT1449531.1 SRPBCC family protein [Glaciecola sp. XM2]